MSKLVFSVDSALLQELGEKLVETVHIALAELVKNAYDADATEVKIIFRETKGDDLEIKIIDDGFGMTLKEVRNYWMRIATTVKKENRISIRYGRPKTGSKGIGRFSCRRLGNQLELKTIGRNEDHQLEETEVSFPWGDFKAGTEVTKIECSGKTKIIEKGPTGTTLTITGGRVTEWKTRGYDYLKRQLAVLVANRGAKRDGYKEDPGFNIFLDVPQFEGKAVVDLREQLISAGWGTLTAKINDKGQAVCNLKALGIGQTKEYESNRIFKNLKGVTLELGIFLGRKKENARNKKIIAQWNLSTILEEWGGVQVRYNGFRVYPYGEGEDDWLNINRDRGLRKLMPDEKELLNFAMSIKGIDPKRVLLSMLSMRNYIGCVEIGPEAKDFEMKANREGFIKSDAVGELKDFVRFAIDWGNIWREYYIRKKAEQDSEVAREHLENILDKKIEPEKVVENAVEYLNKEVDFITKLLPSNERNRLEKNLSTATKAILKHDQSNKQELHHLRLIASTSTLLLIFSHEVKSLVGSLEGDVSNLEIIENKLEEKDAKLVRKIREGLELSKSRLSDLLGLTSLIGEDSRKAVPQRISFLKRVETAEKCFQRILDSYEIKLDYSQVSANLLVGPILEAELYSIILNVLSNSIKSIIASGEKGKITIKAAKENNQNLIRIMDTGIGISKAHYDDVFVPFIADPEGKLYTKLEKHLNPSDRYIVGTGSGLGLSIVKEIIQIRKGSIRFVEPKENWKAELEIILP